jgi:hypothetical protein
MPFPKIRHCLVCEDLRLEKGNKATILGFYGVAPNVGIKILDLKLPLQSIMFMFIGGEGEGQFKVALRILNEKGVEAKQLPELDFNIEPPSARTSTIAFGLRNFTFDTLGTYTVQLSVDGKVHYETTLEIEQAKPEDLK